MTSERGFMLAEILVAGLVVAIGLSAVASAMTGAARAVAMARAETTAVFLAEAHVEELRASALSDWSDAALASGTRSEVLAGGHRRWTTVTDDGDRLGCLLPCKGIRVRVQANVDGTGGHVPTVDLFSVVARRR